MLYSIMKIVNLKKADILSYHNYYYNYNYFYK